MSIFSKLFQTNTVAGILVCVLLALLPAVAIGDDIVLGSGDWCPYVCDPKLHDGKMGYLPDIAKTVLERAGHRVSFRFQPFARTVLDARQGIITGIPGVFLGDVPDFVFPQTSQGAGINTFYVPRDSTWRFTDASSLDQLKSLTVVRDYYYGEPVQSFMKNAPDKLDVIHGEAVHERCVQRLLLGRSDAWIEDNQVAAYFLSRMKLEGTIIPVGAIGKELSVFIAFSPAHPQAAHYARLIDSGVATLRQSGELQRILAEYGLKDWAPAK